MVVIHPFVSYEMKKRLIVKFKESFCKEESYLAPFQFTLAFLFQSQKQKNVKKIYLNCSPKRTKNIAADIKLAIEIQLIFGIGYTVKIVVDLTKLKIVKISPKTDRICSYQLFCTKFSYNNFLNNQIGMNFTQIPIKFK